MQNIKNKKALSNVLTTMLIILITIAAIAIIYKSITPIFLSLSPAISCIEMQSQQILKIESACFNTRTNDLEIRIKRSLSETNIESIKFLIETGTASNLFECSSNSCSNCLVLEKGQTKTYYFSSENSKEVSIYISSCLLDKVKIGSCN